MEFIARQLEESDYEILSAWWKHYNFTPPVRNFLPQNGTGGIMIEDEDGTMLCAGFIYETNSDTALLEFVVANPENRENRDESILVLIDTATSIIEEWGFKFIFATVGHKKLIDKYVECGYTVGDQNTTELIKTI